MKKTKQNKKSKTYPKNKNNDKKEKKINHLEIERIFDLLSINNSNESDVTNEKNLESKNDNNLKELIEKIDEEEFNNYKNIISTEIAEELETESILDDKDENYQFKISDKKESNLKLNKKRNTSIDIIEDIKELKNYYNEYESNQLLELDVKDKIFNSNDSIEDHIIYEGNKFKKDYYQPKDFPQIVNYRCIYQRKNEHLKDSYFCNAMIKRITDNKKYYFKLVKKHSEECINLVVNKIKNDSNIIGNYNMFIEKCQNYLNKQEIYDKKLFNENLLKIYNEGKYNFKLRDYTINTIKIVILSTFR